VFEPLDLLVGEVWCACTATFADGSEHAAAALCRGDSDFGPALWTFRLGEESVRLVLPPAPRFVLAVEGPAPFADKFGKQLDDVFPIELCVVPRFAVSPRVRSALLTV
jgi:hypothetical protein